MRVVLRLSVVAAIATALAAVTGPASAAVEAKVATGGGDANLRVRHTTKSVVVGQRSDGRRAMLRCRARGQKVAGTRRWYKLQRGAWISAAAVRAPRSANDLPECPSRRRGDDYYVRFTGESIDPFRFYSRYCTSFAAWRVNQRRNFTNFSWDQHFGNAEHWDDAARKAGLTVTKTPRRGDVAQWNGGVNGASAAGHVGYVRRVYDDGDVLIEEYNWTNPRAYGKRRIHRSEVSNFIRF